MNRASEIESAKAVAIQSELARRSVRLKRSGRELIGEPEDANLLTAHTGVTH